MLKETWFNSESPDGKNIKCEAKIEYTRFSDSEKEGFLLRFCPLSQLDPELQIGFTNSLEVFWEKETSFKAVWNLTSLKRSFFDSNLETLQLLSVKTVGGSLLLFTRLWVYQFTKFDPNSIEPISRAQLVNDFHISSIYCSDPAEGSKDSSGISFLHCYASYNTSIYSMMYSVPKETPLLTPWLIPVMKVSGRVRAGLRDLVIVGEKTVLLQGAVFELAEIGQVVDAASVAFFAGMDVAGLRHSDKDGKESIELFTVRVPATLLRVGPVEKSSVCLWLLKECSLLNVSLNSNQEEPPRTAAVYHINQNFSGVLPKFRNKTLNAVLSRKMLKVTLSDHFLGFVDKFGLSIYQTLSPDSKFKALSNSSGFLVSPEVELSGGLRFKIDGVPNCYKLHRCLNRLSVSSQDLTRILVYSVMYTNLIQVFISPVSNELRGLFYVSGPTASGFNIDITGRLKDHIHITYRQVTYLITFSEEYGRSKYQQVSFSSNLKDYYITSLREIMMDRPRFRTIKKGENDDVLIIFNEVQLNIFKIVPSSSPIIPGFPNDVRFQLGWNIKIEDDLILSWGDYKPKFFIDYYSDGGARTYVLSGNSETNETVLGIFECGPSDCLAITYFKIEHPIFTVFVDEEYLWILYLEEMSVVLIDLKELYFETETYFSRMMEKKPTFSIKQLIKGRNLSLMKDTYLAKRFFVQTVNQMVYLTMVSDIKDDPNKSYVLSLNMTSIFSQARLRASSYEFNSVNQAYGASDLPGPIFGLCSGLPSTLEYRIIDPHIQLAIPTTGYSFLLEASSFESKSYTQTIIECKNPNSYDLEVKIRKHEGYLSEAVKGFVQNYSIGCVDDKNVKARYKVWRYNREKTIRCNGEVGHISQYVSKSQEVFKKEMRENSSNIREKVKTSTILNIQDEPRIAMLLEDKIYVVGLSNYSRILAEIELNLLPKTGDSIIQSLSQCNNMFEGGFREPSPSRRDFILICKNKKNEYLVVEFTVPSLLWNRILNRDLEGKDPIRIDGLQYLEINSKFTNAISRSYLLQYRNGIMYVVEPTLENDEYSNFKLYILTTSLVQQLKFEINEFYSSTSVSYYTQIFISSLLIIEEDKFLIAYQRRNVTSVAIINMKNPNSPEYFDITQNFTKENYLLRDPSSNSVNLISVLSDVIKEYELDFDELTLNMIDTYVYSDLCDSVSTKKVFKHTNILMMQCQNSTENDGINDDSLLIYNSKINRDPKRNRVYPIQQLNFPDEYNPSNLIHLFSLEYFIVTSPDHLFAQYKIDHFASYNISHYHMLFAENVEEKVSGQITEERSSVWDSVFDKVLNREYLYSTLFLIGGWFLIYFLVRAIVVWRIMDWKKQVIVDRRESHFEDLYNKLMNGDAD